MFSMSRLQYKDSEEADEEKKAREDLRKVFECGWLQIVNDDRGVFKKSRYISCTSIICICAMLNKPVANVVVNPSLLWIW